GYANTWTKKWLQKRSGGRGPFFGAGRGKKGNLQRRSRSVQRAGPPSRNPPHDWKPSVSVTEVRALEQVSLRFRSTNFCAVMVLAAIFATGCAGRRVAGRPPVSSAPAPVPASPPEVSTNGVNPARGADAKTEHPGEVFQEGEASWYGAPFHGRRASNGEV